MKKTMLLLVLLFISFLPVVSAQKTTCLYFFYGSGCPHCREVEVFLNSLTEKYDLEIKKIDATRNQELFKDLLQYYNVPKTEWGKVPTVFISDFYCVGDAPCIEALENEIIECEGKNCECVLPTEKRVKLTIPGITGLALVDAINPCALAVLIILLTTILLKYPKQRKKALAVGLSFTVAIFLCYFTMGLLIILGFKSVTALTSLSVFWLYRILGIFAILMGLLNLKDFFKYGAGKFVMEVPMSWRPKMKKLIKSATSATGAFVIGLIVSLFLLPCTAGPYFVAGGILAGIDWLTALPWLFYYNVLFVIPMIGITLVVYAGLAAVQDVSGWREKNIRILHLIAGIVLLGLGIAMVLGWV